MNKIIYIYKLLLPYLWHTKKARLATIITLFLIGADIIATTYFPYIWKNLISVINLSRPPNWFLGNTILLFTIWFFIRNSSNLREIAFFSVTNQAIKEIRLKTIFKTHTISLQNLEKYNIQEIISATSRISTSVRGFMRVSFISIFPSIAKIASLSIALFTADKTCFGVIVASIGGLLAAFFCLKYYTKSKYKAWHLTDNVTVAMGQNLHNTTTVRFNSEVHSLSLKRLFDLEADAWSSYNFIFYFLHLIQNILFYVGVGIVFCLLILRYVQGSIGVEKIVLVYGLITAIHGPLVEIIRNLTRFFGGVIDLHKTLQILHLPSEIRPLRITDTTPRSIQLNQISFSYNDSKKLLHGINLTINPGDKIGIFGPSGTGKSTLCHIIAGLIAPNSGQATYGNLLINQIDLNTLGKIMVYIPQINNIQNYTTEEHKYGLNLKKRAFSGGEYQKYLLEQVLQSYPQIIILDEIFNALDKNTAEELLQKIIQTVPTVILVSHSLSLINKIDRVFELKDTHLIEVKNN